MHIMPIPVKICGITSIKDAKLAINYGISAIGFIFCKESPRYICPNKLAEWVSKIPVNVKKVGEVTLLSYPYQVTSRW